MSRVTEHSLPFRSRTGTDGLPPFIEPMPRPEYFRRLIARLATDRSSASNEAAAAIFHAPAVFPANYYVLVRADIENQTPGNG